MFGPEYIPAAYLEERLAAEKAKREAEEKRQQEQAAAQAAAASRAPGQPSASSLSQLFSQKQQMSRPGSSTVLGGIYHSLAKTKAGTSTPPSSQASRGQTPCPEKEMTAEEKRAFDEKWREIDMVSFVLRGLSHDRTTLHTNCGTDEYAQVALDTLSRDQGEPMTLLIERCDMIPSARITAHD